MDKCCFPRCNNITTLRYMGRDICDVHWEKIAGSDGKTEKGLLAKIGLTRNEEGAVEDRPITKKEI